MNTPILKPEQYNILWSSSWLSLYSSIEALLENQYDLALCSGSVFLSSINYWKYPINNWRKTLDMIVVKICLFYQLYKSFMVKDTMYVGFVTTSISSYYIGSYFFDKEDYWTYTYFHFGLHLIANMGNISLLRKTIK